MQKYNDGWVPSTCLVHLSYNYDLCPLPPHGPICLKGGNDSPLGRLEMP